jgi:methyltransferase family protein
MMPGVRGWRRKVQDGWYPRLRAGARRLGYHLVKADYYSPIPDVDALPDELWTRPSPMPGVDLRLDAGIRLLEDELAPFVREWDPPERLPGTAHGYYLSNGMYGHLDGQVLYALVRHLKPARVVEVGAGFSTLVFRDAAARNAADGRPFEHRVYDPYPAAVLANAAREVQIDPIGARDIPAGTFAALRAGDVLFIDTTHTVKPANDVLRLLLEVLPAVAPGVVVHVHDFFRPYEYPRFLFERHGLYWQEHYLLQAFLAFNDAFEVLLANHALVRAHRARVEAVVPGLPPVSPGSALWLRRR